MVVKRDAGTVTDITFTNMSYPLSRKQLALASEFSNSNTGGVGVEVFGEEKPDKRFPVISFERGFEALDGKTFKSDFCHFVISMLTYHRNGSRTS